MMTIDEAIAHAEWCAKESCGECAEEHRQLAEWLKELRQWKRLAGEVELDDYQVAIFRLYAERIGELIRILDHDWNIDASWDGLRKFWYVGLTEKGVAERDERDAENAKLRKLVNDMWICVSHGSGWDCTGCRRDPDSVCILGISEFSQRMRNLGIEVDE